MNSKHAVLSLFLSLSLMCSVNSQCFTMPPKVVKISKWAFSVPNVESSSYIHKSHECPTGYTIDSQHSHIVTSIGNSNIINLDIHGYSVCCEEPLNSYERISIVNNTDHHI